MGAQIDGPEEREFNGLPVDLWPRVSWSPSFAMTFADLEVSGQYCFLRTCFGGHFYGIRMAGCLLLRNIIVPPQSLGAVMESVRYTLA